MGSRIHFRQILAVATVAAAVPLGLGVAALALNGPSFSRPGASPALLAVELAAGWLLVLAGLLSPSGARPGGARAGGARRRSAGARESGARGSGARRGAPGWLLVLAGFTWLAADAWNPDGAPPLAFTAGSLVRSAWPALIAHVTLLGGTARLGEPARRSAIFIIAAAYVTNLGVLGILPTVAFDPSAARCSLCPVNLLAIWNDPGLVASANRIGFFAQGVWIVLAGALIARGFRRAARVERRAGAAVAGGTVVALGAVAADGLYSIPRGLLSNDRVDVALWALQGVALAIVAIGIVARWRRGRHTRQRVARVVLDLATAPAAGELAGALGRVLDDPALEVLYPLDDGRLVNAAGSARPEMTSDRRSTPVLREGRIVAMLVHRADLGGDPARLIDALDAARLALENERLLAQTQARMLELRASRAEVVAAAASERRRLERDLHDGSQQRLLALAIDLAIAREHAAGGNRRGAVAASPASDLEDEVRAALAELRELAHGIVPRALADDGLAAALEELAERSPVPLELRAMPTVRLPPAIEAAGYLVVHGGINDPAVRRAYVAAGVVDDRLVVELDLDVTQPLAPSLLVELEDQCGALGGSILSMSPAAGRATLRSEMPCVS